MATKIIFPKHGLQMTEGIITKWLVKEGHKVEAESPLFEMETDKANIEILSPTSGTLLKIIRGEGEVIPVNEIIAVIGELEEDISELLGETSSVIQSEKINTTVVEAVEKDDFLQMDFDITVIGGGPGGYVAAIRAAQLGRKVAVIEEREMGGTCLNRGCIPTKFLLHSAEVYHTVKHSGEFGVLVKDITFDYARIAAKKDAVIKQLRMGVESLVKNNKVTIFKGRAIVKNKNTIEISGKENLMITTDKMIIASGSRPFESLNFGNNSDNVFDSDEVLALTNCPDRIVIIGGGIIGVEFATIFNILGKKVTIIEMMENILPGVDREISDLLQKLFECRGITIFTGSKVISIDQGVNSKVVCVLAKEGHQLNIKGDAVILAFGRKPNIEGLGLENVGIDMEQNFIKVNNMMETSVQGIYAVGDVTGKRLLAHIASRQGLVAATNAADKNMKMDYHVIPECIYTRPEIASVGLTETVAIKNGYPVEIGRFTIAGNGKSLIMGEKEGFIKIIANQQTGKILGVHIIGPRATELISEICIAMKLGATIEEVAETIHPHPTVSEIIMEAAYDVKRQCVHKPKKKDGFEF